MNAHQMNTGRGYWLAWFLASSMGYGIGAFLGISLGYRFFPTDTFANGIAFGFVMGATGGCFQWFVLRERIAGAGLWALASAVGFGLALGALEAVDTGEHIVMAAFLMGVVSGILQWLILRRKLPRAGWWLLANLLGSLVGANALPIARPILDASYWYLFWITLGLLLGARNGAITGAALVWLLRPSPSSYIERLATAH
jgi:hypothetical protein